ncbi:hypothetical protein [Enhygromyxa salina]|uniref:Uncharacterized protein n=1 Tax=Enhygromyxa salina TaxID=215803 RepID=A0A2S9XMR0_9BACT|nr:hypothetical protein [Enhygromyxa salina]PRP94147.1 hypothetical protein ENSA7_78820 [Enhygromyxa salina]
MLIQLLTLTVLLLGPAEPLSPPTRDAGGSPPHLGALGITGGTMLAASVGLLVAGSVHLVDTRIDLRLTYAVGHARASGRAMVGLGIVGVGAGITALACGIALRRGSRRGVAIVPNITPTGGGIWLTGRF